MHVGMPLRRPFVGASANLLPRRNDNHGHLAMHARRPCGRVRIDELRPCTHTHTRCRLDVRHIFILIPVEWL